MAKRNTIQREIVRQAVLRLQSHPTADEVYKEVAKVHPTISRTTVYRDLRDLCEQGVISRLIIPGSPDRFDHLTGNHFHVRCMFCGRIEDVDIDYVEEHPEPTIFVKDSHGFRITGHSIVFDGVCPDCDK